ncbi:hypothetical protein RJ641_032988 [Dillenia turbinata]|uniref:DEUBAD domain-containing protein n=1 Tax=Dillenia turbinata TaxID=194707 RepID=A0AAN8ZJ48_9MAGN
MAIEKNNFRVSRLDAESSPRSGDSVSTEDEELQRASLGGVETYDEEDDGFDDADSGVGSDDFDLLELGEIGAEFCQFGTHSCSLPFELYDLPDLRDVLSINVWNECLSEEDRYNLAKFLPDMDQFTFIRTLKDLFEGGNFHFGSPIMKLFDMLKGGLCEPRVALYRQGLNFFQKRQHYHLLRKYQNLMVSSLFQIRDAWQNCRGYSIEEKLRVLNIVRSQKSLMYEKMENYRAVTESEESDECFWNKKLKDRKLGQKMGRHSPYLENVPSDFPSRGRSVASEPVKYGKKNPKGTLKLAGSNPSSTKELVGHARSANHAMEVKSGLYDSVMPLSRQNKLAGYDSGAVLGISDQRWGEEVVQRMSYDLAAYRDRTVVHDGLMSKAGYKIARKKHEFMKEDQLNSHNFMGMASAARSDLHGYGRNRNSNGVADGTMLTSKPSNKSSLDYGRKAKYSENVLQSALEDQIKSVKSRSQHPFLKGMRVDLGEGDEKVWRSRAQGGAPSDDPQFNYDDWNPRQKKWATGRESPDIKLRSYKTPTFQLDDRLLLSEFRAKPLKNKCSANSIQNGLELAELKGVSEETESDSSEQVDEEEDSNSLRNILGYPGGVLEGCRSSFAKTGLESKMGKYGRKDKKGSGRALDGIAYSSKRIGDFGPQLNMPDVGMSSLKAKQKGKMHDTSNLHSSAFRVSEDNYVSSSGKLNLDFDEKKPAYKLGRNGRVQGEPGERIRVHILKNHPAERRQKGEDLAQLDQLYDCIIEEEKNLHETARLVDDSGNARKSGKRSQSTKTYVNDPHENSDMPLVEFDTRVKKRKVKVDARYVDEADELDYLQASPQQLAEKPTSTKKRGKRKVETDNDFMAMTTSEPPPSEIEPMDVEVDNKPQKRPFTLITPTVHTGFSFSIVHLLSAVRMALVTPHPEDSLELGRHLDKSERKLIEDQSGNHESSNGAQLIGNVDINNSDPSEPRDLPSLAVQEIVNRVRSNPGDPCILETQEPLQDLVRGVLKIFSSKTAPLGAKGWKPLVVYEKSTKSWSWIGPFTPSTSDHEPVEEETSPEAWGLPHKMLVKLVDAFANWLKNGQETLQQIGSLPAPPVMLMQFNLDEKERFRDLRAQKSLTTISPSSEEVRDYFRKEEVLRYLVPDRAFSYTAADGRKSIVAPLRRCGGKPTSKARDHFMLKRNRPPHVTVLCLVRDAAARLPGSIGTRADVCTLIRDSQYIVEDVSDAQVNQVVSGALDRLHYERDPCVQYDAERKLWVYLHREREEEDFEDDGTSSTKKWKRQKKDAGDQFDQDTVSVAFHGTGERLGDGLTAAFDSGSDLNAEASCINDDNRLDLLYGDDVRQNVENVEASYGPGQGNVHQTHPMVWEALALNPMQENKLLCQENSTNEDFDDEAFGRQRPVGLLIVDIDGDNENMARASTYTWPGSIYSKEGFDEPLR